MAVNYTTTMIDELKAYGELDYAKAEEFAEKHNISARSVISKVRALEIPYKAKEPGAKPSSKTGPKASKPDLIASFAKATNLELKSLGNMTIVDIEALLAYVSNV